MHDDIRPNVLELAVGADLDGSTSTSLTAELATQPRGVRPAELIGALVRIRRRGPARSGRVCRTHQWIMLDGARREPLPASATRAPHAEARAS